MNWYKRNPIFFSILILLGIVFVLEIIFFMRQRNEAEEVRQSYESKLQEYDRLREHNPSLTRENLQLAAQDLERVEANLDEIRVALGAEADVSELFENPPADTTQAFFDITSFVDDYRDKARSVVLDSGERMRFRDDEYFGFSRYRNSGPPSQLIESVFKQRQIAGYLLDTLFEVRPVELVRFRRGDVAARRDVSAPSSEGGDVFTIPAGISARIPDFVDTYEFQVTFKGYTSTLRDFLNRLATFEMPLLVRSVEVQPAEAERTGRRERRDEDERASETDEGGPVPIVDANLSQFVVTIEFIELVGASE